MPQPQSWLGLDAVQGLLVRATGSVRWLRQHLLLAHLSRKSRSAFRPLRGVQHGVSP
jgi:hypothetical protein